jgi:hypothetical protein
MIDAALECFTKMFTYIHRNISLASNTNREQVDTPIDWSSEKQAQMHKKWG